MFSDGAPQIIIVLSCLLPTSYENVASISMENVAFISMILRHNNLFSYPSQINFRQHTQSVHSENDYRLHFAYLCVRLKRKKENSLHFLKGH